MKKVYFLGLIVFLSACGVEKDSKEVVQTSLEIHKPENAPTKVLNVGFLAINGVYNSELMAPYDIFQHTIFHTDPGMKTFIVSPTLEPIVTFEGITVTPHYSFENVPEIDVLVVPSAEHNMDSDLEDEVLISFVKEKGAKAQFVMSLCDGAFILAQAGLLDNVKCTTFPSDIAKMRKRFPDLDIYEDVSFVHDGKAITSSGGAKSYDPALYLVEYLYGKQKAKGVAKGLVIDWKVGEIKSILP
ncbi:DJ-1/PfpI family protein [Roseivirga sp. E12]|uniref:DJ-1/PfpI family protein n=1 Tax=Roseivirga sp. E12 TaxID=2819237 RepID=UPI001ABCC27B|nr:DJ-1/PfpI family protein [Roseivirga sp. E12]MBO3698794.1 DJ-1/PfpI family protein [Roseivirga sp. E12]